jgi:NADH dehydrogenase
MRVFITGATGFVGREVVRKARQMGHSVGVLARHPLAGRVRELASQAGTTVSAGDVREPGTLATAFQGADAVIHLVGIISEIGRSTFENIHTEGTRNLVNAAQRCGIKRFLHMSALGTRPNAVSRYHQSKWAAEEIVRQSGLAYTIFRPSLIYGPEDKFVNLFYSIARSSPVLPVMGSTKARFQPVAVEVVAAAFARALSKPKSVAQTFDLCGPETFTFPELLDQILQVMRRKRLKVHIPLSLARLQASFLGVLYRGLLRKPPPLNRDQLIMLQEDNIGDCRKAEEILGLKQRGFREGIGNYLAVKRET